uniref:DH domain-containing protein n=2 Tax=Dendroctonus ponderosae TaxID=77166 RepID=A0AAR5QEM6_DENPD
MIRLELSWENCEQFIVLLLVSLLLYIMIRMETKISAVAWQQPLALNPGPIIFDIPYQKVALYPVLRNYRSNHSFLHSPKLRDSILESKKAFLSQSLSDEKPEDEQMEEKPLLGAVQEIRRPPCKKISFKIKKQSSLYRRSTGAPKVTNIPLNKVAELTKKFNEMVDNNSLWDEHSLKSLVKRVDSATSDSVRPALVHRDSEKVSRKPSVKTKPVLEPKKIVLKKTTKKSSIKRQNSDKLKIRAKFQEKAEANGKPAEAANRPTTLNLNLNIPKAIIETSPNGTSVKAAIEIFEKRSSILLPKSELAVAAPKPKPLIPEKPQLAKKMPTKPSVLTTAKDIPENKTEQFESEFEEDKVEIINIPAVLPQRRCDSMYETLNMKKVQTPALKCRSVDDLNTEVQSASVIPNSSFLWRDKSPSVSSSRSSINAQFQERLNNAECNATALPSAKPVKPHALKSVKRKMPLPQESPGASRKTRDVPDYEEISTSFTEETLLNEETFKGYDEITKPLNEVEILDASTEETPYEVIEETAKAKEDDKHYEEIRKGEKIYEELSSMTSKLDDGYEPIGNQRCSLARPENIYETLPHSTLPRRQEPLPPRPPSSTINEEIEYNCYESIYTKKDGYYESIYGSQLTTDSGSNRDSVVSSDHQTNSLYGQPLPRWEYNNENTYYKPPSDVSDRVSERSDEWEDVTDNEERESGFIVVRERHKGKKPGWSQHFREQLSKTLKEGNTPVGDESDHHYESLHTAKEEEDYDYDSFESDTESESSMHKTRVLDDSGIDVSNSKLPEPPNNQSYGLMKFAEKNMKKISRNFTMNITKSLTRMRKHMSKTEDNTSGSNADVKKPKRPAPTYENVETRNPALKTTIYSQPIIIEPKPTSESQPSEEQDKMKTISRPKGGFLTKFRRSMSLSVESANEVTSNLNGGRTKSTFYLTDAIDIDSSEKQSSSEKSLSPVVRHGRPAPMRPTSPPPPAPITQPELRTSNRKDGKSSSWYADSGVFKNIDQTKRPNTFWYAEVGLYQSNSSPSTSSAENSGSNLSVPIKPFEIPRPSLKPSDFINQDDKEQYNNIKNENPYYADSVNSFSSIETKQEDSLKQEIQLRLQDEPLYQFYDAAVLDVSYADTSDFEASDSDNYEDVSEEAVIKNNVSKHRPSAMELVSPKRDSMCFNKSLWCEIPEVLNSSVLSTLSGHQKKLQEAKFEILTSEASYLNSLNVLNDHFLNSFRTNHLISKEERNVLFGHVEDVRNSSEKLLHDLEKCWQDNILLHGICDIVQKHAEENFNVYIPYCENQVQFDEVLKSLKERLGFTEFLRHLEMSEACQSLSLYSFLMLPMQRITRWPLLVDAVLKRLSQQDSEYFACQFALGTLNKIVGQCNEAARQKERETELIKLAKQLEFPQAIPHIPLIAPERWLVRCGPVIHMQPRNEDTKLTFGKRFSKTTVHLFLFNDLFVVAKEKGDKSYIVQQYCHRNLVELSSSEVALSVPAKEAQGKNLIFLTVLENQDGKMIEYLLACSCESDKERWVEALTPPKSEDPEETLYDCWDCPQVFAVHNYTASQPDELALAKNDVINVLRKMADGWYHGEKIRDGQTGWFPANHTVEIANVHVRARNLKQRYRLLAHTENYLKSK